MDTDAARDSYKPILEDSGVRAVIRGVSELRPHSAYRRHNLTVSASKISALLEQGDLAIQEPLLISRDGIIIDGYARLEVARLQGRATVSCIEYALTQEKALRFLLQRHCRSDGLNAFCRIILALELEPGLKEQARLNQQVGGHIKGSSNLTEADRMDVRKEIARAAGVSVGNVTKVKQLTITAHAAVGDALRSGEISIHRAWLWCKEHRSKQLAELQRLRELRAANKTKRLIARHRSKHGMPTEDPTGVLRRLSKLDAEVAAGVTVVVVNSLGKAVFLTNDLLQSLPPYQELLPT